MKHINQILFVCLISSVGVLGNWPQQPKVTVERGDITEARFKTLVYLNITDQGIFKKVFRVLWTDKRGVLVSIREPEAADLVVAFIAKAEPPPVQGEIAFDSITADASGRMIVYYRNDQNRVRIVWVDKEGQSADKAVKSFLEAIAKDRANIPTPASGFELVDPERKSCPEDKLTKPVVTQATKARYTEEARKEGIHGVVIISVVFGLDGKLSNYRVVKGLPYGLTASAIQAASLVRFEPAMCNGQPVAVRGTLEYSFLFF
jgi:TonB family protein